MSESDGGNGEDRRELVSARVKAIEAELWAAASPHEREAAMLVGQATDQQDLPHVLAAFKSIGPKDAIEARLAALVLSLTHASAENLKTARLVEPYPDGLGDKARLAAVRLAEAACKCVDALAKHRSGGATEHRVTVTHTGPAADVAVGVRLRQGEEGDGQGDGGRGARNRRRPHAKALTHAPEPEVWCADPQREPVPVARDW